MKITNNLGLPAAIVAAVENDPYNAGDCHISVTRLIAPPRKVALEALHREEITEDAADRIWSLLGQSIHVILERSQSANTLAEIRLTIERHGWKLSGAFDDFSLADGILTDYKTTSAYSVKDGGKAEWDAQLNVLAHILREHGHEVKGLQIVAILRDWSRSDLARDPSYPRHAAVKLDIPLWTDDQCEFFISERIRMHQAARVQLPECSASDRWQTADKWAVTKVGNKKAAKLCLDEAEAAMIAEEMAQKSKKNEKYCVEYRRGECKRCENYCTAAPFCEQWRVMKTEAKPVEEAEAA